LSLFVSFICVINTSSHITDYIYTYLINAIIIIIIIFFIIIIIIIIIIITIIINIISFYYITVCVIVSTYMY